MRQATADNRGNEALGGGMLMASNRSFPCKDREEEEVAEGIGAIDDAVR